MCNPETCDRIQPRIERLIFYHSPGTILLIGEKERLSIVTK